MLSTKSNIIVSALPHFDQYFGLWAMHEPAFDGLVNRVRGLDIQAHVAAVRARVAAGDKLGTDPGYQVTPDGVAVVQIVGTLTKYGSSVFDGPSTLSLRQTLRKAAADPNVLVIVLLIDSPGGSSNGIDDLAGEVQRVNAIKPVTAYIEDTGASAAYYVASQAGRIVANPAAIIGGIGTYAVIRDYSESDAKAGIKTLVFKAGELKGAGVPGTKIGEKEAAECQRIVDQTNDLFVAAVARGRKLSPDQARKLADGRIHLAAEARALKLIDEVGTCDAVVASIAPKRPAQTPAEKKVSTKMEESAILQRLDKLEADNRDLKAQLEKRGTPDQVVPRGGGAVQSSSVSSESSVNIDWKSEVDKKVAAGMSRQRAVLAVEQQYPGARIAFVNEHNRRDGGAMLQTA